VKSLQFMLIAGEASGDTLGGELIAALKKDHRAADARFFGVGGPRMQEAGMELISDFTRDSVFGMEAWTRLFEFRRRFNELLRLAVERKPDVIVCVDFAGFNRRFARAVRERVQSGEATGWNPKIIQYVSPQVWASRPRRADLMARDIDLLLAIFPFEKAWYARRTPQLRVEFVGHPMVDRYAGFPRRQTDAGDAPRMVFLPGSRPSELKRHLPVMAEVLRQMRAAVPRAEAVMVLPDRLAERAREIGLPKEFMVRPNLAEELSQADLAIAKSGTVTLECAYFRVPTVVLYQMSALTYAIASRIVQVKWAAMPNILANEEVCPEFIQAEATSENIARAGLELLRDVTRRNTVKAKLDAIASSLGEPGAAGRAAEHILNLLGPPPAAS
jgi:lipid-A-disaccharide synthase